MKFSVSGRSGTTRPANAIAGDCYDVALGNIFLLHLSHTAMMMYLHAETLTDVYRPR